MVELFPASRVVCAFSTGRSNNMSFSHGNTIHSLANRKSFLESFGIDHKSLVCGQQVHGSEIRYVTLQDRGKGALSRDTALPATDALITDEKDLPIAVFTADCLSVFLFDPMRPAIGVVHAGWKGSKERITSRTIEAMGERFGSKPEDLRASFGPTIRSCCYEVGNEFRAFFPEDVCENGGRWYLDLVNINKKQLVESGVQEGSISDPLLCTSCENALFFSYRREKLSCGRMMSVMMLK